MARGKFAVRIRGLAVLAAGGVGAIGLSAAAQAQSVSPVTVTPQSLVPEHAPSGFHVTIPETGLLEAPSGADHLDVTLADVRVEGAFTEVAAATEAVAARLRGKRVTLAEIYAAASQIESFHARAGYILARVSIPPQKLVDNGTLRILVTDGFIESVNVSGLPVRAQRAVEKRIRHLVGRRHITLHEIEQSLMMTGDVPGLTLRSTLMRGERPGGAKLILEGGQRLLTGRITIDNSLHSSLGGWELVGQLALNSALGLGEQIYGFAATDYGFHHVLDEDARERVLGAGVIMPLGDGTLSLNPEATFARTSPKVTAGVPASIGTLRRLTLRANAVLVRTRHKQSGLSFTIEQIAERNLLPAFATAISRDRYVAIRLGGAWSTAMPSGENYALSMQLSQGLGDAGAISISDALASGVPFSRQGSQTDFTKLVADARAGWRLDARTSLSVTARGQTSFGKPMFRAEQFAMESADGLSAYVGGRTAVDEGAVARAELARRLDDAVPNKMISGLAPYLFSAFGAGKLHHPTALEPAHISAFNLGAGIRASLLGRFSLGVEYAHGISDYRPLDQVDRANVNISLRF